ncbi:MAG: T9SS type A sorting domain-containing protein [Chitinophagales bacterium]|nr:T9SS type A sorting domain-containing protein [Chitinophagales bacterium]
MKNIITLLILISVYSLDAQTPKIWGISVESGLNKNGLIYELNQTTSPAWLEPILSFDTVGLVAPATNLVYRNGYAYGIAFLKSDSTPTLYSISTSNKSVQLLNNFTSQQGQGIFGSLTQVEDTLFGYCNRGGQMGMGTIFKYNLTNSSLSVIYNFEDSVRFYWPSLSKLIYVDGVIFGVNEKLKQLFKLNTINSTMETLDNVFPSTNLFRVGKDIYFLTTGSISTCGGHGPCFKASSLLKFPVAGSFQLELVSNNSALFTGRNTVFTNDRIYLTSDHHGTFVSPIQYTSSILELSYYDGTFQKLFISNSLDSGSNFKAGLILGSDNYLYTQFSSEHLQGVLKTSLTDRTTTYIVVDTTQSADVKIDISKIFTQVNDNAVNITETHSNTGFLLFPNPASQLISVSITTPDITELKVEFFSVDGRLCKTANISESNYFIDISNLTTGIYFTRFSANNKPLKNEKIIVH